MTTKTLGLHPRLIVKDCPRAIAFYIQALNAREVACYADKRRGGHIVYAELDVDGHKLSLTEEQRDWQNLAPGSLGGSAVIITLEVADAYATGAQMQAAGAEVVFPIADQFYGERQGRLRDPFGHLWIISQATEKLSHADVQRRIDEQP
jgi:PhnB protein